MVVSRLLKTPQRWNRYAYVINNPLARIDPDGNADFASFDSFRNSTWREGDVQTGRGLRKLLKRADTT